LDSEDTLRKEDNTLASSLKEFHASYLNREGDDSECSKEASQKFESMKEDEYQRRDKFSSTNSDESSSDEDKDEKISRSQS